jgi:hypothetical protein
VRTWNLTGLKSIAISLRPVYAMLADVNTN